jgi:hypothetical protein
MNEGAVHGSVRLWLRLEGLVVLLLATFVCARRWVVARLCRTILHARHQLCRVPRRAAGRCCHLQRSPRYIGPVMLGATLLNTGTALTLPLVWGAHIGFDRVLGYGLKYPTSFGDTHLGRIGRR